MSMKSYKRALGMFQKSNLEKTKTKLLISENIYLLKKRSCERFPQFEKI